jgi:serine/threonine protein kinase/tetratricopeptide (TPR) repeat protein
MVPRTKTLDEAVADFHALYVLDERNGRLRAVDEYQRRFPGFEEVVRTQYAFLSGDLDAAQVDLLQTAEWAPSDVEVDRSRGLGPYRLLRRLGRGAQGTVYLAEHEVLHRTVALKVLANKWLFSKAHQTRFEREARAAARLDHPGVCSVYDFGHEDDIDYIAMRYVEGETLSNALRAADERWASEVVPPRNGDAPSVQVAGTLPLRPTSKHDLQALLMFFEQCAEALQAAHDAGVIHRDVKPGNIMVTPALTPVILDFGLARDEQGDSDGATRTGDLIGTRGYMAPEQIRGDPILDARIDVYALGVVLYECLTLTRPHSQPTWETLLHAVTHEPAPDVRKLNPNVPRAVALIVQIALEKEPERRYRSARALAEDLRRARTDRAILATPPGVLARCARWVQRRARMLVAVAGVALALALVASLIWGVKQYVKVSEIGVRTEQSDRFESSMERELSHPYRMSSRLDSSGQVLEPVDLYAAIRKATQTLTEGGVDPRTIDAQDSARIANAIALEPANLRRTSWMLFQLVENIDELGAFRGTPSRSNAIGSDIAVDSQALTRIREGAVRLLDRHLTGSSALVWRAYEERIAIDGEPFAAVRDAVLASSDPVARLMLCHIAWGKKDKALALEALSEGTILSMDDHAMKMICLMERGSACLDSGQFDEAENAFKQGQAGASSRTFFGHFSLAKVAFGRKDFATAEAEMRLALELEPEDRVALTSLANLLSFRADFENARDTAQAAVTADPDYAHAHLELGRALVGLHRVSEALPAFNEALRVSSAVEGIPNKIELALADGVDLPELDRSIGELLAATGLHPWWLSIQASARLQMRNTDAALALIESGLAIAPRDNELMARRGEAYLQFGEPEVALASFEWLLELHPDHLAGRLGRARCLAALRRTEEAVQAHLDACAVEPVYLPDAIDFVRVNGDQRARNEFLVGMERVDWPIPESFDVRARPRGEAVRRLSSTLRTAQAARRDHGVGAQDAKDTERKACTALEAALDREDARTVFLELQPEIEAMQSDGLHALASAHAVLASGDHAGAVVWLMEWLQLPEHEIDSMRRVLDMLLRLGESEKAADAVERMHLDANPALRTLVARVYLADGRLHDVWKAGSPKREDTSLTLTFAMCWLLQGQPRRTIGLLDDLPCFRRSYPIPRSLRARAMMGDLEGAQDAAGQSADVAADQEVAVVATALEYVERGSGEPELVLAMRAYVEGRLKDGASHFIAWCSDANGAEHAQRLTRVCEEGLALPLARGGAAWLSRASGMDPGAIREEDRGLPCVLDLLESHLALCRREIESGEDAALRERRLFELQSVLTDPEFALLRRSQVHAQLSDRLTTYFHGVRSTLGSRLWRRT